MPVFSDNMGGRNGPSVDVVSEGNLERLLEVGSTKAYKGNYLVWDKKITQAVIDVLKDWDPREFRDFVAHSPEDVDHARS